MFVTLVYTEIDAIWQARHVYKHPNLKLISFLPLEIPSDGEQGSASRVPISASLQPAAPRTAGDLRERVTLGSRDGKREKRVVPTLAVPSRSSFS